MATQQNRIYVTLSPRMRTALNLCSALDGSTPTTYAASLLSSALLQEIEKRPALHERWVEIERNALQKGTWGFIDLNEIDESNEHTSVKVVHSWSLTGNRPQDYVYGKDDTIRYDGKKTSYFKAIKTARAEDNDFADTFAYYRCRQLSEETPSLLRYCEIRRDFRSGQGCGCV